MDSTDSFFDCRHEAVTGDLPPHGLPDGVEALRSYSTPHGDAVIGIGKATSVAEHDRDAMLHVAGRGVPHSYLPLGSRSNSTRAFFDRRSVIHSGAAGRIGTADAHLSRDRRAGWGFARSRREIKIVVGDASYGLRAIGDDKAVLHRESVVLAELWMHAGSTATPPTVNLEGKPLLRCAASASPSETALGVLLADSDLAMHTAHPVYIAVEFFGP